MKKNFLTLISGAILTFTLLIVPNNVVKADTTFTETESNDTIQTANDIVVESGTNVITGAVRHYENKKLGITKDESDWYKVTFKNAGKCDFNFLCTSDPTSSTEMYKYYVKGYTSDFEEMDSFRYGLAHDANETYYFKVEENSYPNNCYDSDITYTLTLTDDTSEEYVGMSHTNAKNAYMLTVNKKAYSIGWYNSSSRWFSIKVPSGKKATITFEPTIDADIEAIAKDNFNIEIFDKSNTSIYKNTSVKSKEVIKNGLIKSYTDPDKKIDLVGPYTYLVKIGASDGYADGTMFGSCNKQWYSLYYTLTNAKKPDTTKPTITGVKNGKTYKKAITIKFSDKSGIKKATLNNKKIKNGVKVKKNGSYTLIVTDKAGNSRMVRFKIRK